MSTPSGSPNYYDLLHVSRDAPVEIIRGSYRTLMQQLKKHPDLGGDTADAALINEAYSVLSNADRRADYDAKLKIMDGVAQGMRGSPSSNEPSHEPSTRPSPSTAPKPEPQRSVDPARQCAFCDRPHRHGAVSDPEVSCDHCGSPLRAAGDMQTESSDHRAIVRINKKQRISVYTDWPQENAVLGQTEDISLNGLRLVTRQPIIEGQRIKLVSPVIEATGVVARCNSRRRGWSTDYVLGISFMTLRLIQSTGGLLSKHI